MCKNENIALPREMSLSNKTERIVRMSGQMHVMNNEGHGSVWTDCNAQQYRKLTFFPRLLIR